MMPWPPRQDDEPINWGDEPVEPPPPPYTGRSIRLALGAVYDYAGSSIAASLVAFVFYYTAAVALLAGLLPLTGASGALGVASPSHRSAGVTLVGLVVLIAPLILSPLNAGLYTLAHNMLKRDDPHLFDIWKGAVRLARPAWALGYTQSFVTTILVSDVVFLLKQPGNPLRIAGILVAYILLFWLGFLTYQWPLLVEQGKPLKTTLIRSALLSAHNPFYTLAFTIIVLVMFLGPAVVFFSVKAGPAVLIPVSLAWGIVIASLQTSATLEILRRYPDPS